MSEPDPIVRWLRAALPPVGDTEPDRDLWPAIAGRAVTPPRWTWLDVSVAACVAVALLLVPGWVFLIAFHL